MSAEHFLKQRQKPNRPAVDRVVVDKYAALLHYFFQVAAAQRIRGIPANAHQNDVDWEAHSFGSQRLVSSHFIQSQHRPCRRLTRQCDITISGQLLDHFHRGEDWFVRLDLIMQSLVDAEHGHKLGWT